MRDYIKLMLGAPIIQIEIADIQINQVIEDSLQIFARYGYHEGTFLDDVVISAVSGVSDYPLSAITDRNGQAINDAEGVYSLDLSFGIDGINVLFSPSHILLYDQFVNKGQYPGGWGYGNTDSSMALSNYYASMGYLNEIKLAFGQLYTAQYFPGRRVIRITPTPKQTGAGTIRIYRHEYDEYLYNNILFKQLCLGKCKRLWGRHLDKFPITLPDGGTINGASITSEGIADETEALRVLKAEAELPEPMYG